jgi:hypothetical protein
VRWDITSSRSLRIMLAIAAANILATPVNASVITVEVVAEIDNIFNTADFQPIAMGDFALGDQLTVTISYDLDSAPTYISGPTQYLNATSQLNLAVADHYSASSTGALLNVEDFSPRVAPPDKFSFQTNTTALQGSLSGDDVYAGDSLNRSLSLSQINVVLWDYGALLLDSSELIDISTLDLGVFGDHGSDYKKVRLHFKDELGGHVTVDAEISAIRSIVGVVPIPASVWLFGSALAGLGWMRRKQTV